MMPEYPDNDQPSNLGLTIGFIGTVIVTLGYIVETIGEGIELSETLRAEKNEKQAALEQSKQLSEIQSKLNYLVDEIAALKKRG